MESYVVENLLQHTTHHKKDEKQICIMKHIRFFQKLVVVMKLLVVELLLCKILVFI